MAGQHNGYFYVMHRFDLDNVKFVKDCKVKNIYASISLGVKQADYDTVAQLWAAWVWYPTTSPSTSRTAIPTMCSA